MKKLIACILACSMLGSMGVYAEDTTQNVNEVETLTEMNVSFVVPDPDILDADKPVKNIGVNQEKIKIAFDTSIDSETISGITFTDSENASPVGGIITKLDDGDTENKTVIVKFGELKPNETYTLTVPVSVKGTNQETLTTAVTKEYKTSEKVIFKDDFSGWTEGKITGINKGTVTQLQGKNLYVIAKEAAPTSLEIVKENDDTYLKLTADGTQGDLFVGSLFSNEENMIEGKVVTTMQLKAGAYGETKNLDTFRIAAIARDRTENQFWTSFGIPYSRLSLSESEFNTVKAVTATSVAYPSGSGYEYEFTNEVNGVTVRKTGTAASNVLKMDSIVYLRNWNVTGCEYLTAIDSGFYTTPAPLGEVIYDSVAKTVEFTVNTDIDKATLANLAVETTRGNVLETTVTYDETSRKMTVVLSGDIYYEDGITVDLSDVKSVDGFAFGNDITLVHDNTNDVYAEMNIEYFMPDCALTDDTGLKLNKIGVNQGSVKTVFDTVINAETLDEITFVDSDGNAPVGGIIAEIDERDSTGKTVVVKFGELTEDENYTLTIPVSVKGIGREVLASTATKTFTTTKKVIVDEDFDDWDVNTTFDELTKGTSQIKDSGLYLISGALPTKVEIVDENGDKSLKITSTGTEGNMHITAPFENSEYMSETKVVAKMGFKGTITSGVDNVKFASLGYDKGDSELDTNWGTSIYPSSTEFTDYTAIMSYENFIRMDTYQNNSDDERKRHYTFTRTKTYNGKTTSKTISKKHLYVAKTNAAILLRNWNVAGEQYITYAKAGFYMIPGVFGDVNYDAETTTLKFVANTDVDIANAKIEGAEGTLSYNAATREVTAVLKLKNGKYDVSITGLKSVDGFDFADVAKTVENVVVDDYTFEDIAVTKTETGFTVGGSLVKNATEAKTATLWIALYDSNDKLIAVADADSTSDTTLISETFAVSRSDTDKLYYLIWDANMNPFTAKTEIK